MTKINKRVKSNTDDLADQIVEESKKEVKKKASIRFDRVISTGSVLLDLAISGGRIKGGGIPPGILFEIYGPSGAGKTAVLASICASAQRNGGTVRLRDPEARLDKEYAETYGISIDKAGFDYSRPDTVEELFIDLWEWDNRKEGVVNIFGADSIASLSTELEMGDNDGDKRGQRQAKLFSQSLRKSARIIGQEDLLVLFTNQLRQGEFGEVTSGGKALEYYASLRGRVSKKGMIEKIVKLSSGKEVKKIIGIESQIYISKSTIDDPYRSCPFSILFGVGIDDIRDQLQWYKDITKETKYDVFDGKTYVAMEKAIRHIEENNLEIKLRERTIELWREIESKFKIERKPKVWF
jgi:protein RecA